MNVKSFNYESLSACHRSQIRILLKKNNIAYNTITYPNSKKAISTDINENHLKELLEQECYKNKTHYTTMLMIKRIKRLITGGEWDNE
jgi:hypothetical protein